MKVRLKKIVDWIMGNKVIIIEDTKDYRRVGIYRYYKLINTHTIYTKEYSDLISLAYGSLMQASYEYNKKQKGYY